MRNERPLRRDYHLVDVDVDALIYHVLTDMAPVAKAKQSDTTINCKLLLIGNSSVGKSSLLLRFSDRQWLPEDETSATIGVDFRVLLIYAFTYWLASKH